MAHAEHRNERIYLELVDDAAEEEVEDGVLESREVGLGEVEDGVLEPREVGLGEVGSGSTPPAAPSTGGSSTGGYGQGLIKGIGIQGK